MKYNIVLIPNSDEVGRALITLAKEISVENGLKPDYLLKDTEQSSIPHASVFQFEIEKNLSPGMFGSDNQNILESIWKRVSEAWQEVLAKSDNMKELVCTLPQTINYKHDTIGTFAGISWSEIIVNKIENPLLQQFHDKLREKLAPLDIQCLNASGERYNPHFTLFNIRTSLLEQAKLVKEIPESHLPVLKSFSIKPALGIANDNWEFTTKLREEKSPELNQEHKHEH